MQEEASANSGGARSTWRPMLVTWLAITVGLLLAALLLSEGEPVCEGPLIRDLDASDPPQCNSLTSGLKMAIPEALILAGAATAVTRTFVRIRRREAARSVGKGAP